MRSPLLRQRLVINVLWAAALLVALGPVAAGAEQGADEPGAAGDELLDLNALGAYESADQPVETAGMSALCSGRVLTKLAQDLRRDNGDEYLFSDLTLASAKLSVTLNPNVALTVEGLFIYDVQANSEQTATDYDLTLWEGYGRFKLGPLDLTLGQQHVAWGICDGINPTDIVNPRDYDRIMDAELGIAKLPAVMARAELYMPANLKLDGVLLPFFTPARYSIVGQDVALFGNRFPLSSALDQLREDPQFAGLEQMLEVVYPDWQDDLQSELDDPAYWDERTQGANDDLSMTEGALRFSGRAQSLDFSASYFYLWDDLPTLHVNPEISDLLSDLSSVSPAYSAIRNPDGREIDVDQEPFVLVFHRAHAFGADFGTTLGGVGLRAEGLYTVNKYTYTETLDTRRMPQVNWAINIDYQFSGNWILSGLFYQSAFIGETSGLLLPPSYDLLTVLLRKGWLDERLTTELAAIYDFSYMDEEKWGELDLFNEDVMVTPLITYALIDPLKITLGANLVSGERYRLLGLLADNTRAFLTVCFNF